MMEVRYELLAAVQNGKHIERRKEFSGNVEQVKKYCTDRKLTWHGKRDSGFFKSEQGETFMLDVFNVIASEERAKQSPAQGIASVSTPRNDDNLLN